MCDCRNGHSYSCKYGVKMTKEEFKNRKKQYNKLMKGISNVK